MPAGTGPILLRCRELGVAAYETLHDRLADRGWALATSPVAWRRAHLVPLMVARTGYLPQPPTTWTDGFDRDAARTLARQLGGVIVHDHVSSCVQPDEAMAWVPDGADEAAIDAALDEILAARGDRATGGFVLRRPVSLAVDGSSAPLERVTRAISWRGHELTGGEPIAALPDLRLLHVALGCPFLCVDVAEGADGAPVVVGVDDASGVDLPPDVDVGAFYEALHAAVSRPAP